MKHVLAKTLLGFGVALAGLSITAACGGGGKKQEVTTPEPDVKAEVVLELGELVLFEGDTAIAKIHADGKSEYFEGGTWKPGPVMKQDGSIEFEGTAVAKVNADGTIVDAKSSSKLPLVVTNDKMTISGEGSPDFSVEIAAETGAITVVGEKQPPKAMRIDGAKTPGQRKTALVFLAMMVGSARTAPPPSGGETPTVSPPG